MIDPPPPSFTPEALSISRVPRLFISSPAGQTQEVHYEDGLGPANRWITLTNIIEGDGP
jgi:hypothetical protein